MLGSAGTFSGDDHEEVGGGVGGQVGDAIGEAAPTALPPCPGLRGEPCRDFQLRQNLAATLDISANRPPAGRGRPHLKAAKKCKRLKRGSRRHRGKRDAQRRQRGACRRRAR